MGFAFLGNTQLQTSYENIDFMVEYGLLGEAHQVDSINYEGVTSAIGQFQLNDPNIDMSQGIIMTTGTLQGPAGPAGPNDKPNAGIMANGTPVDSINTTPVQYMYDRAQLTIYFTAGVDSLELRYFFGSEEYLEYVGTGYRDFATILISGAGIIPDGSSATFRNIARFPDGNPVNVNNCHSNGTNIQGSSFPAVNGNFFVNNSGNVGSTLQYDGYTQTLLAKADLVIGEQYVLVLVIADMGDGIYDSGLFIEQCASCNLSSNLLDDSFIHIYPNPFQDHLIVEMDGTQKATIELFDSSGAFHKTFNVTGVREELDMSNLDAGTYFVYPIVNGERGRTTTFVKY